MRECDDETVRRGTVFVDNEAATVEAGELVGAFERGVMRKDEIAGELVELIKREKVGRRSEEEITVFKSVGSAVVDLLSAQMVYEKYIEFMSFFILRVQKPETSCGFSFLVRHRQPVTSVALSKDDCRGFSDSKDGTVVHWYVDGGKSWRPRSSCPFVGNYRRQHVQACVIALRTKSCANLFLSMKNMLNISLKICILCYGQAFPGHRGPVSCLTFRQGTTELFSCSFDRSIKIWNAEGRTYINTLFGHQSEVLTIDSLRKERVLTVGRDSTLHLSKVIQTF
ncbi:hypothetical protein C2S53_018766 [Perilla frutescens var. hirtella]|uniref:Uncharacterized protein n=1 Tax=Perilla frutescens var. hirtella TaxID=608512 RepID=A0AAD4P3C7_PERFH|nr:hypothetical protein C2S53_018766 [Perilla frutescens var. hirtella]